MSNAQRPQDEPQQDHLKTFREAIESELRGAPSDDIPPEAWEALEAFCDNHQPASDTSEFQNRMIEHLIECATIMRLHVHSTTGRWPALEETDTDLNVKARDIAYLQESTMRYWKKDGLQEVPLDEVLEYRNNKLRYATIFYDTFYGH